MVSLVESCLVDTFVLFWSYVRTSDGTSASSFILYTTRKFTPPNSIPSFTYSSSRTRVIVLPYFISRFTLLSWLLQISYHNEINFFGRGGGCNIVNCPRAIYNFANCPRTLYNIVNCPGTLYNIVNCPWVIFAQGTVYKTMSVLGVTFGDLALYFNARDTDAAATRLITTITTTTITVVFRPPASVSVVQRENAWEVHKDYDEGAKILLQRSRGGL